MKSFQYRYDDNLGFDMDNLIPLIVNIVGGAIGGGATSKIPATNMSAAINTATGAISGGMLGQVLQPLLPMLQSGDYTNVASMAGNLVGGGAGGAIVTALVGVLVNKLRSSD